MEGAAMQPKWRGGTGANFRALNGHHHCPGAASTSKLMLRRAGRILAPSESPPEGFLPRKELEFAQLQKDENGDVLREPADAHCPEPRYGFETVQISWFTEATTTHHMVRKAVPGRVTITSTDIAFWVIYRLA
uniref:Uncharacterized protein n=1 Tax=Bionectria ochroleuca TaxID=29856 RepID=A0A0B7KDB9_BIOOC